MKFSAYTDRWITEVVSLKKPSTQASFRSHLSRLQAAFGNRTLSELTNAAVQTYFSSVSKELAPKSVKNLWATLRLVLEQARKDGLIDKLPEPVLPKVLRSKQPCFTIEQMQTLIAGATERGLKNDEFLYKLLAETGLRIGEALALTPDNLDRGQQTLRVKTTLFRNTVQESPKTDASNRIISLSSEMCGFYQTIPQKNMAFIPIFQQNTPATLHRLHKMMQYTGIALDGAIGFHAFRRGNASLCAQIGVPPHIIAMRLGHRGSDITSRYVYLPELADREWAERIGDVLSGHDVRVNVRKVNTPVRYEQTTVKDEAVSALVNLGYRQKDAQKAVMKVPAYTLDEIIRQSLPYLVTK